MSQEVKSQTVMRQRGKSPGSSRVPHHRHVAWKDADLLCASCKEGCLHVPTRQARMLCVKLSPIKMDIGVDIPEKEQVTARYQLIVRQLSKSM